MGFRFRKSINIGGGFRINLSKTGIGYSFGVPGLRFTQMANGRTRRTYSIPGTGLSYVEESNGNGTYSEEKQHNYDEYNQLEYSSSVETLDDTFNEFVQKMNKLRTNDRVYTSFLILAIAISLYNLQNPVLFLLPIVILLIRLLCQNLFTVDNHYEFLSCADEWYAILNIMLYVISLNNKISFIENQYSTTNYKYNSGAGTLIAREKVIVRPQFLNYIKLEYAPYSIKIKNKVFYFLPNLILADDGYKYSWISYKDLDCSIDTSRVIEEDVPKDATIVDYTWKYTNKEGGPDRRFNGNYQIAICKYCEVHCFNNKGFDITLQLSNVNSLMNLTGLSNILKGKEFFEKPEKLKIVNEIIKSIIESSCCPICGDDNIDDNKICTKCGHHVEDYYTHRQHITKHEINIQIFSIILLVISIFCLFFGCLDNINRTLLNQEGNFTIYELNNKIKQVNKYNDFAICKKTFGFAYDTENTNYLKIVSILPGSSADIKGLKVGDIIIKINNYDVQNGFNEKKLQKLLKRNKKIKIAYNNGNISSFVELVKSDVKVQNTPQNLTMKVFFNSIDFKNNYSSGVFKLQDSNNSYQKELIVCDCSPEHKTIMSIWNASYVNDKMVNENNTLKNNAVVEEFVIPHTHGEIKWASICNINNNSTEAQKKRFLENMKYLK